MRSILPFNPLRKDGTKAYKANLMLDDPPLVFEGSGSFF
jgi:hypothetical protein